MFQSDTEVSGQVVARRSGLYCDSPCVDNAELVSNVDGTYDRYSVSSSQERESFDNSGDKEDSSSSQETEFNGLSVIRQGIKGRHVSSKATNIIMSSWRFGTQKQYATYIKRWFQYCRQGKIDPFQSNLNSVLNFLTDLFEKGLSYSVINTARSSLSAIGLIQDGIAIGSHPLVVRFMKGVYNLRPAKSRYNQTWDVSCVLTYLRKLSPVHNLSLKLLTFKLVMLLALTLASRTQSLYLLSIDNMKKGFSSYTLEYSGLLKQSKAGKNNPVAELRAFPPDRRLCVVFVLKEYLNKTKTIRGDNKCLFISYIKPFGPVSKETISRWLRTVMYNAGIDCTKYKPHSIRSAATSKAKLSIVPIQEILKVAGWSSEKTFGQFYDKVIEHKTKSNFSNMVLQ